MDSDKPKEDFLEDEFSFLRRKRSLLKRDFRKRQELIKRLREKYLQCASIVDHLKDGIFVESIRGEILDVNAATCRMLGYSREELLRMTVGDLVPPEVRETLPEKIQALTVKNGVYIETVNIRKDGTLLPVEVSNTLVKVGKEKRVIAIIHDITERVERRKELQAYHEQLEIKIQKRTEELVRLNSELQAEKHLFIGGPTVVIKWRAAPGWPVEYVSPNVENQLGYSPEEFSGSDFLYESIVHPEDRERVAQEVKDHTSAGRETFEQIYRLATPAGDYRWVSDFTVVVRNEAGDATHFHGYVVDITERKEAEEELRKHREHLEEMVEKRTAEMSAMVDAMARRVVRTADLELAVEQLKKQLRDAGLDSENGVLPPPSAG